uniref:Uncharacterized protein n=1 Tax=Romanomermis culicivorax TaxID=13658 RepID=A0A915JHV7_ROMCU
MPEFLCQFLMNLNGNTFTRPLEVVQNTRNVELVETEYNALTILNSPSSIQKKLKAKKFALKGKKSSYRLPEPKSSPMFGGDGSSSNYHGITVQEKISHLPILNLPFVQNAMNDLSVKSGMPNMLEPFLWKPKHCMVSATCGPRERRLFVPLSGDALRRRSFRTARIAQKRVH